MKFAPNRLYIEEYVKCANCGVLIYEERGAPETANNHQGREDLLLAVVLRLGAGEGNRKTGRCRAGALVLNHSGNAMTSVADRTCQIVA